MTVIHSSFLPFIQLNWATQFFLVPKAYNHNVCAHYIRDVFSNKQIEKAIMQFEMVLGMIFLKKTAKYISELQKRCNNPKVSLKKDMKNCIVL